MKTVGNVVSIIVVAIVGYFAVVWITKATQAAGSSKGGGIGGAGGGSGAGSPLSSFFGNNLGRTMQQSFQSILQANLPALGLTTTDLTGDSGVFIPSEPLSPFDFTGFGFTPDASGGGGGGGGPDTSMLQTSYDDSSWAVS